MNKLKMLIPITILLMYIVYGYMSIVSQNAVYICRKDMEKVLEDEHDYLNEVASYLEEYEYFRAEYDLSTQTFYKISPDGANTEPLERLCKQYSFNMIGRDEYGMYVVYNRLFDHSVHIGMSYDYDLKKWYYNYTHNYGLCAYGHLNGYKIYDFLFNRKGVLRVGQ